MFFVDLEEWHLNFAAWFNFWFNIIFVGMGYWLSLGVGCLKVFKDKRLVGWLHKKQYHLQFHVQSFHILKRYIFVNKEKYANSIENFAIWCNPLGVSWRFISGCKMVGKKKWPSNEKFKSYNFLFQKKTRFGKWIKFLKINKNNIIDFQVD